MTLFSCVGKVGRAAKQHVFPKIETRRTKAAVFGVAGDRRSGQNEETTGIFHRIIVRNISQDLSYCI